MGGCHGLFNGVSSSIGATNLIGLTFDAYSWQAHRMLGQSYLFTRTSLAGRVVKSDATALSVARDCDENHDLAVLCFCV